MDIPKSNITDEGYGQATSWLAAHCQGKLDLLDSLVELFELEVDRHVEPSEPQEQEET